MQCGIIVNSEKLYSYKASLNNNVFRAHERKYSTVVACAKRLWCFGLGLLGVDGDLSLAFQFVSDYFAVAPDANLVFLFVDCRVY